MVMISARTTSRVATDIRKCRYQSTTTISNVSNNALPFEDVPTLKSTKWPFVGQLPGLTQVDPELFKQYGFSKGYKLMGKARELTCGKDMLRYYSPLMNPKGNGHVVYLFNPSLVEYVHRNEGKYPNRGPVFEFLGVLRSSRPDAFGEYTGLLSDEGEKWHNMRSKVQQDMMRPQSALYYTERLQEVADDFVKYVEMNRTIDMTNHGDFINDLQDLALEHITAIALDTRLGCFGSASALGSNAQAEKAVKASRGLASEFLNIFFSPPLWKIHPTLSSPMRRMSRYFNDFTDFSKTKVDEASKRIKEESMVNLKKANKDMSILEKFIRKNGADSPIPSLMASDMLLAGIETTGNTIEFLLYNLAMNKEKQDKLREEIMQFGDTLTSKDVDKLKYMSACMKESMRLHPTVNGGSRFLDKEIEVGGYKFPAGTWFYWSYHLFAEDKRYFPDSETYRPERWLDPVEKKSIHPFAVLPFSYGPREAGISGVSSFLSLTQIHINFLIA